MINGKIKSFVDLLAWQKAHKLVLQTYKLSKTFPREEIYGITNQIRRCAISVTSNIAEGFSRKSKKEKINFYYTSVGSLTELQNQLLVARDVKYISKEKFKEVAELSVLVSKLLHGLIKSSMSK